MVVEVVAVRNRVRALVEDVLREGVARLRVTLDVRGTETTIDSIESLGGPPIDV